MIIGLSRVEKRLERYTGWLDNNNIEYTVLDYEKHDTDIDKLDECSGLILSGGVDIYPEIYCDWDTAETKGTYLPERDGFELNLLEKAIENKMPVLGICRGCQLINVYFRGSMIFDIEDIRKVNHRKISKTEDRTHGIRIIKDTLMYEIVQEDYAEVNSAHHQSADRLGEGLMMSAKSDDGIVEAIEYADKTGKPFFIGVQWHPERFSDLNAPVSKNILDKFISECKSYSLK
ncbi:MAG TPA: gamma-glutamyl-gamma-aminobutyrate hydrolase family protein [Ignavibacteria bacterium]|nr:gamma-glutamyl-gamma-aminobutyrate hydrolase family protein [Ignavibacteria bacterium]